MSASDSLDAGASAPKERYFDNESEAVEHLLERMRLDGFANVLNFD